MEKENRTKINLNEFQPIKLNSFDVPTYINNNLGESNMIKEKVINYL